MNTKYHKRLCFSPDFSWVKEYGESLSKLGSYEVLNMLGIEAIEVFKNEMHAFVIIDIKYQSSLTTLKSHLKKQLSKTKETKLIESIIKSKAIQPLERIFKMIPQEDNLIEINLDYKRFVMTLELTANDELLKTYKNVHKPEQVWPEIINNMKTIGVTDMELYLNGYQAFLLMDTNLDFDMEKDGERWANLSREKEWQAYVAKFQKVNPENNAMEKWKPMNK